MTERLLSCSKVIEQQEAREREAHKPTSDIKSSPALKPSLDIKPSADIKSSLDIKTAEPLTQSSDEIKSRADIKTSPDIKSVDNTQWTAIPNDISDHILRTLELSDQVVLMRLYRLSWGHHRETCKVATETLAEACNIHPRQVPRCTKRLAARGLIEVVNHDFNNPDRRQRGTTYRMLLPKARLNFKSGDDIKSGGAIKSRDALKYTIKDKALNKNISKGEIHRLTPEEITEQAGIIREVLEGGYTTEQAEAQFKGSFHPDDWLAVMEQAQQKSKR